ncbi:serine protease inhibitor 2.1-like [Macrobrachium nipponense]|uniref:serine protease inhibitor 2.1-like n=1 Tax=Macrobrachium nipponense TaxID=159736 RepID=UPI0030C84E34
MLLQVQRTSVWLGAAVLLLAAACVSQTNRCFPDETPEPPNPRFPQGVEDFGMAMFKSMASLKEGSLFVSPYSLWSVLTLAYFGSEGRTRHQLEEALNLRSKTGTFTNWNALKFLLQGNSQTQTVAGAKFNSLNRAYFATNLILQRCLTNILFDLRRVDFTRGDTAKNIINDDVHVTTEGKISNFLDFIPPQTQLVLINAVYFKGLWATPFNPKDTRRQEFLIPPGKSGGVVDMMVQTGFFKHGYAPSLNASIVELPYQDTNTSMFVILPDTLDTDRVLQLLDRTTFQEAVSQMTRKKVEVVLPRFKLTTRVESELKTALSLLGITDLFDARTANLTAFSATETLYADKAIHEATVEVTEEGTVAAAASGILVTRFGGNLVNFVCNRPFVFLITDKNTGITLFAGKLVHPADIETL